MGNLSTNIVITEGKIARRDRDEEARRAEARSRAEAIRIAQDRLFDEPLVPQHCHLLERLPPAVI